MYNKVDEKFIASLQAIVGKEHVYADPDTLDQYKQTKKLILPNSIRRKR